MSVQSPLSPEQLQAIRTRFLASDTIEQLAVVFAIEPALIRRAVRGLAKQRPPSSADVQRFWAKVDRSAGPQACWWWRGGQAKGRGQFAMQGTTHQAHRVAYLLTYGPIPPRQVLIPECGSWLCVNPDHWIMQDPYIPHVQGEAHGQAKLRDAQVVEIRERRAQGGVTLQVLADQVGVSESTIRKYVRGQRRRSAPGPIVPQSPTPRRQTAPLPPTHTDGSGNAQRRRRPARPPRVAEAARPTTLPSAAPRTDQVPPTPTPGSARGALGTVEHSGMLLEVDNRSSVRGGSHARGEPRPTEQPCILMAALDDLAALALDAQLNALGYAVAGRTRRGDDAIELAARLRPDLILLDRRLADRAGFGLIRRLTAQHVAPVIVLGTGEDRRALRQAVAAGAFGYLALPTSLGTLEATIAIAIARAADLANLHDQVGQLGEALAARRVIEQAKGILMQRHNLSERSAYARLRQYARDRRVTMQVVAEAVIEADRQLGT